MVLEGDLCCHLDTEGRKEGGDRGEGAHTLSGSRLRKDGARRTKEGRRWDGQV